MQFLVVKRILILFLFTYSSIYTVILTRTKQYSKSSKVIKQLSCLVGWLKSNWLGPKKGKKNNCDKSTEMVTITHLHHLTYFKCIYIEKKQGENGPRRVFKVIFSYYMNFSLFFVLLCRVFFCYSLVLLIMKYVYDVRKNPITPSLWC